MQLSQELLIAIPLFSPDRYQVRVNLTVRVGWWEWVEEFQQSLVEA